MSEFKSAFTGDYQLNFYITEHEKHSIKLAETASNDSTDIICVGGDGSLNEVINGVMQAKEKGMNTHQWENIRVGLYPKGTGNDFAKTVLMPADCSVLKKCVDSDSHKFIDLGVADFIDRANNSGTRYFINITDTGMGGVIAQKLANYPRWMGPNLTFQRAIISTLIGYRKQQVKVKADSFDYDGQVMNLVVANGKYFGNGLGIAPDALADDGLFSIVIVGKISMFDYLRFLGDVRKSKKINHPQLTYLKARNLYVESPGGPLPIDMDGEFIGYTPLRIRIVPRALKFICPNYP